MPGLRVSLGYHNWGTVHGRFCTSLCKTLVYEGRRIAEIIDMPSPYVEEARNRIVQTWLDLSKTKYLLMLDADIEFPEDAPSTMMFIAETFKLPILGANYALGDFGNSFFAPRKDGKPGLVRPVTKVQPNMLYRNLGGAATGFLLLERGAMEQFRGPAGFEGPWHWFNHDREKTSDALVGPEEKLWLKCGYTRMGEDMSFCQRARRLGMEIAGTTHVPLIHHKYKGTVPIDQFEQFEGMPVYTKGNPWLEKRRKEQENAAGTGVPQEPVVVAGRQEDGDRPVDHPSGVPSGGPPDPGPGAGSGDGGEVGGDRDDSGGPPPQAVQVEVRGGASVDSKPE